MNVHGEYLDESGRVVATNHLTTTGLTQLIKFLFGHAAAPAWSMGFCMQVPQDSVALADMNEPSLGVGGYARVSIPLDITGWPSIGSVNNEVYVESLTCSFPLTGALDAPVQRLFLTDGTSVIAISSPLNAYPVSLSTPQTYKYRLYFR